MGRKRVPVQEKKIKISISIQKSILEEIRAKHTNVSEYIEKLIKKDL